jgi:hypothetical protein
LSFYNGQSKEGQVSKGNGYEANTGFGRNVGTNSNILVLRRDHSTTLELKEVILSKHLALKLGLGYGEI